MFLPAATVAFVLALVSGVHAHGYLRYIDHKGTTYGAWQVFDDPYFRPPPLRYDRTYADNGPVVGFTGPNITCNNGANDGANVGFINVAAGDKLKLVWDQWNSAHSGPVMTYMAKCAGSCLTFKGDTGAPWFKIDQFGFDTTKTPPWGSDYLREQGAWWEVTIPPSLSAGEYLLRHEILGLHAAGQMNGAQFYPSCVHLRVSGSGSAAPSGVSLPGAYDPRDPGILVDLWRYSKGSVYTAPGGPVWSGAVQTGQTLATPTAVAYKPSVFAPSVRGNTAPVATTSAVVQTTTTRPTSLVTTTRVITTTTSAAVPTTTSRAPTTTAGTGASLYGQCGGKSWTGPTTCAQGTCKVSNDFYSQCLP